MDTLTGLGRPLVETLLDCPTPFQLRSAARHAYRGAQLGPFGLALDDRGALVLAGWPHALPAPNAETGHRAWPACVSLWRSILLTGDTLPSSHPSRHEDRIRHALQSRI